jgi:hypothetical protein
LAKTFVYHAPKGDQPARYMTIREAAKMLATTVIECCPQSRERSLALTKIEEASMWANAGIARNE